MRKKRSGRNRLARAIDLAQEGDPGFGYVEACAFLARWVIGLSLHTRHTLEARDHRCTRPGTPEHEACQRTVSECASLELSEKSQEIGRIGSVVIQTTVFWECALGKKLRTGEKLDVPGLIYDGALHTLSEIGDDPEEVEISQQMFGLLSVPHAGTA